MLTVDCQPLQSFARLNECRDQSFWSLENERERKRRRKWKRGNGKEEKKKGGGEESEKLAAIQMLEYTHNTHTDTHWAVDAPLSVWHWCCQTNQGTLSLFLSLPLSLSLSLSHLLISVREEIRQLWRCNDAASCCCCCEFRVTSLFLCRSKNVSTSYFHCFSTCHT